MKRKVSNLLALAVLTCLRERPMHPYEISTTLKERGKERSIKLNYGSLYSVVEALQRHELIKAVQTWQEGNRPPRTTYEITDTGLTEMADWLRQLVSTPVKEYPALEAGLALLPALSPDNAVTMLEQRSETLLQRIATIDEELREVVDSGLPRLFVIEEDFHVTMLRAELEFVRTLVRRIRDGSLGGVDVWRRLYALLDSGRDFAEVMANPRRYFGEEATPWLQHGDDPSAQ